MRKIYLEDELSSVTDFYKQLTQTYMNPPRFSYISKKGRFLYDNMYVISDGNPLGDLMAPATVHLSNRGMIRSARGFLVSEEAAVNECNQEIALWEKLQALNELEPVNKTAFFLCVDCEDASMYGIWPQVLRQVVEFAGRGEKNMCIVSLLLPEYPAIPDPNITSLSEREFGFFMEEAISSLTPAQSFFVEMEALCRCLVNEGYENLNISRVDNLFGPGSNRMRGFDLEAFVKQAFQNGVVEVSTEDYQEIISCSYIRDAFCFAIQLLYKGRKGQIYNFCSYHASIADIKSAVHSCFREELALKVESEKVGEIHYHCLNTLKFFQCGWNQNKNLPLTEALYRTVCDVTGSKDNNSRNTAIYSGKLTRIKELEVMMLRDLDELCRKHDIEYFLCGGTMLGAVRYGHSIPWDDDVDIGMLRQDFDKFRKVSMIDQKAIYNYSSHWNKSGSHYIVDKVRLNGTYFSTKYSSVHEFPDGLFVDVLVYDQTSNNRFIGMIHSRLVFMLAKIIELRWYNWPRNGGGRHKEIILLPFLRLFPMGFYHKLYEMVLTLYKNKKNSKYVIDSTGKLQKKGPFLMKGLEATQRVGFDDGFQAPIPIDCTNYLTFDYGPNYLPEPPLSKRAAPHNFARIDLGGFIFKKEDGFLYREVDVRGELFEQECKKGQ